MGEVSRLGRRLRMFRERHGWTQVELAQRAGVSRTVVVGLETGLRSGIQLDSAIRLAQVLGISVENLSGSFDEDNHLVTASQRAR